jgi:uncharacterized membrane protein YbhN (UPF0104 family)
MKKSLVFLVKFALTAAVLGWLLSKIELRLVIATIRAIPPSALAMTVLLVAAQPLIAAFRWHLIMRYLGTPIPFIRTLQVFWIALFAAALLPGGVAGDGIRAWVLARAGTLPSKSVNSVLLDRAVALAGLLFLVAASVPFVDDRIAAAPVRFAAAGALVAGIAAALVIGLCIRVPPRWQRFRAARAIANLSNDLWAICTPRRHAYGLTFLSIIAIWCYSLNVYLLVRSLGIPVGVLDCMSLAPLVVLVTTLPISLGGWGLREGSMVGLFGIVGVAPAASLSVSILVGLLSTSVSFPGALVWLQWRHAPGETEDVSAGYAGVSEADG